jgi:hypothetical protein
MKIPIKPFDEPRDYWRKPHIHVIENQTQEEFEQFVRESLMTKIENTKVNNYVYNNTEFIENVIFQGNDWKIFKSALQTSFNQRLGLFGVHDRELTFENLNARSDLNNKLAIDVYYLRIIEQLGWFEESCIRQLACDFACNYGVFIIISLKSQKTPDLFGRIERKSYYKGWKENRI